MPSEQLLSDLSEEVKRTVTLCIQNGDTNQMIEDRTHITREQLRKMRKNLKTCGNVVKPPPEHKGRPRRLNPEHEQAMLRFIARHPNVYHEQVCWFLADAFDIKVTQATISRALKRLGVVKMHRRENPGSEHSGQQHLGQADGNIGAQRQLPQPNMSRVLPSPTSLDAAPEHSGIPAPKPPEPEYTSPYPR